MALEARLQRRENRMSVPLMQRNCVFHYLVGGKARKAPGCPSDMPAETADESHLAQTHELSSVANKVRRHSAIRPLIAWTS